MDALPEIVIDELKQLVLATHVSDVLMTVDDVRRFNAEFAKQVNIAAGRFGKIRLLVDCRKLSIQPPEVVETFDKPEQLMPNPDDRYALVLASNLAKIQTRRVFGNDCRVGTFLSIDDAEAWLSGNPRGGEGIEEAADGTKQG